LIEKFMWQPQLLACQLVDSDCLIPALLQRPSSRSRFVVTLFFGMFTEFCIPKAIRAYCFQGPASTLLFVGVAEVLLCSIFAYFYSMRRRAGQLAKGVEVKVIEAFETNEEDFARLHAGETGIVESLDRDGDAMVRFPDHARLHCIFKRDFDKLDWLGKAPEVAALSPTMTKIIQDELLQRGTSSTRTRGPDAGLFVDHTGLARSLGDDDPPESEEQTPRSEQAGFLEQRFKELRAKSQSPDKAKSQSPNKAKSQSSDRPKGRLSASKELIKGDEVQVVAALESNEEHVEQLHVDDTGIVETLDHDGNAMVQFPGHARPYRILKKDFDKIQRQGKGRRVSS